MPKIPSMTQSALTARLPALAGGLRAAPACWAFIGAGAAAIGVYFLLPPDAQSVFFVAVGLASVIAIYLGARTQPAAGRAAALEPVRARAARPGRRRRDLRRLRDPAQPRASVAVDRRCLLPGGVSAARARHPRPAAQARQPDEPRGDPRHRDRLLRRRARAVGVLHRSLQPPALRDGRRAARCDGVSRRGRAAPGRADAAPRRPRRSHHRLPPLARERRALGHRRRDLRVELRHVRRRRPGRRALARVVRGLGRRRARTVDGTDRPAGAAHAATA